MISAPGDVTSRIAAIQSRLAALSAGPVGRVGGPVGSGMQAAMQRAGAPLAAAAPSSVVAAPGAVPGTASPASRATAGWEQRLPEAGTDWADEITAAADAHGVRPELLAALVWTESGFRPDAVSPAGAVGLGQLMPGTAAELGVDARDPVQNLDGAARYLREQLDRFGDARLALAAYNAGPGRVAEAGGVPAIAETQTYVARVTERASMLGAA